MHDRKRIRLAGFDYSASRHYFVTMCVEYRIHSFGFVENKSIQLSPNGIIYLDGLKANLYLIKEAGN